MRKKISKKLKSNKGITMIVLSIAIIVLAILTSMITYYSVDSIEIKKLNNMYNDIEQLNEKVAIYFYENEKIPILIEYPNVENILAEQRKNLDSNKYYVLDLTLLKNVELNYGKDFEAIKENYTANDFNVQDYKDVYIINEESHNIYYIKGIKIEETLYHIRPQTDEEPVQMKTTKISSIEDLIRFQQNVENGNTYENEYVVLTKNLDFDNPNSYDGTEVTIDSIVYTYGGTNDLQTYLGESGNGWIPIGNDTTTFSGTFDGNNYSLTNIYAANKENKMIFRKITALIQNVKVGWKRRQFRNISFNSTSWKKIQRRYTNNNRI